MRKTVLASLVLLGLGTVVLNAEEAKAVSIPTKEVIVVAPVVSPEMIKSAVGQDRRMIVQGAMDDLLKDPLVKSAFWEVYDSYEAERSSVADLRMQIIGEYVKNFETMSDAKVKELLVASYKVQSQDLKLRKKYTAQLMKKVNATVAGRFWQVDDFITSAIKVTLLSNMPVLGEDIP